MPHWTQRISAAIITGDARRCLERLHGLKGEAARAAARQGDPQNSLWALATAPTLMTIAINDDGLSLTFTLRRAAVTTCSRRVVGPDKAPKLRWRAVLQVCQSVLTLIPGCGQTIECLRQRSR